MRCKMWICLLGAVLILGTTGCSKTQEATETKPAPSVTEPEAPPIQQECEHTWNEATYEAPKTCSKCGETEGERKLSYFEEHGVKCSPVPVDATVNGVIYNPDYVNEPDGQMVTDYNWTTLECYSEPAEEEGYQLVHLSLMISYQYQYLGGIKDYYYANFSNVIYDWYTGRNLPFRDMNDDDADEYGTTLEVDGVSYDVSYSKENAWEEDEWIYAEDGSGTKDARCYQNFVFKVPNGYDGLVYAAVPMNEYHPENSDFENIDEGVYYACDEGDYDENTVFFRFNAMQDSQELKETAESETAPPTETDKQEIPAGTLASEPPEGDFFEHLWYPENGVAPVQWTCEGPEDIYSGPSTFEIQVEYNTEWENAVIGVFAFSEWGDSGMPSYTALELLDPSLNENTKFFTDGAKTGTHTFTFNYTPTKVEGYPCILCVMMQPIGEDAERMFADPSFDPPRVSFEVK